MRLPAGFRLLRAVLRNPLDALPPEVFTADLVRQRFLGRDRVYVMAPDLIGEVLNNQADAFIKSEAMQRALRPALGDAILTADGERWRWQRRAAAPSFRHSALLGFLPAMLDAAAQTRDRWLAFRPDATVELGHEMMRTTFDIILATMLSGGNGDQAGPGSIDVPRVEQGIGDYLRASNWTVALTLLRAPEWTPHPGRLRAARARGYLRSEIVRLVAARRAAAPDITPNTTPGAKDLLGLLLDATDPETGQAMGDRDLADNLLTFVTAGHETTALALTWTFHLLAQHRDVENRVLAEIAAVTGGGSLLPQHVPALPYTRQVIQEAMRLFPPAPFITRAAQRGLQLGGHTVAPGTAVYVPVYAVHRHQALWPDPDRFDPDRFGPEQSAGRHRYAYLPFSAGPRICIGATFALLEAAAILATLLPAVRLRPAPGATAAPIMRITLRPDSGMPMRVEKRGPEQ